jgi:hypothetical protein
MTVDKKDKKSVWFLSNADVSSMGYYTFKSGKTHFMAVVNNAYNKFMHRVDLVNVYLQLYLAKHKHRNWKKTAFFGITKLIVDNCHFL